MTLLTLLFGNAAAAHAQLSGIADYVGSGLASFFTGDGEGLGTGANRYAGIAGHLLDYSYPMVGFLALLVLTRAGLKLIYGQSDDRFEEEKRGIANGLMAVVLVFLTSAIVNAFIRASGWRETAFYDPFSGANILAQELGGIVSWVRVIVVVLAIAMIIAAVFTAMFSVGGDNAMDRIKRSIFGAAAGIVLIGLEWVFRLTFGLGGPMGFAFDPGTPTPYPIITQVLIVITYILSFMALIAVVIVIYAGIRLILSLGNEDEFQKTKSLILRALLGLFVILVSLVIVRFVVTAFS